MTGNVAAEKPGPLLSAREERPADSDTIRHVNQQAFGEPRESRLVDTLRENGGVLLSLVATLDNRVVGHILFTPVSVGTGGHWQGAGLGPMAVLPDCQRRGIGRALIEAGEQKLRAMDCPYIVVLGHPEYYPRFGFEPASRHGLSCEWDVPDNVFMIRVLDQAKMTGVSGLVHYRREFSNVL